MRVVSTGNAASPSPVASAVSHVAEPESRTHTVRLPNSEPASPSGVTARVASVPVLVSAIVASSTIPVCVSEAVRFVVTIVFPSIAMTPALTRVSVVSVACPIFSPANCGLSLVQSHIRAGMAVTLSSSISPVPAVLLPRMRFVLMFCIFAKVTESSIMSAVMLGVASL